MEKIISNKNLTSVANAFLKSGFQIFLVGGAIRDTYLGKTPPEYDLATNAKPEKIKEIIQRLKPQSTYDIGEKFGTIGAIFGDATIEITTFRSEKYAPGDRHPEVSFGTSIEEDLSRRDFTINAMAQDLSNDALIDPYHGKDDLSRKKIKVVGDSVERFNEDPLRLLRAIRFAVTLGFDLDFHTAHLVKTAAPHLASVSAERIADELTKILASDNPSRGIRLLSEFNLLPTILPEFIPLQTIKHEYDEHKDIYEHTLTVVDRVSPTKRLRYLALLHDIAKPNTKTNVNGEVHFIGHEVVGEKMARQIMRRLRFDHHFIEEVAQLIRMHLRANLYQKSWTDGAVKRLMREAGDLLDDLIEFSYADITSSREEKVRLGHHRVTSFKQRVDEIRQKEEVEKIVSPLSGDELMAFFKRDPGPWIKPVKGYLLDLVLDGKLAQNDKEYAKKLAEEFVNQKGL